MRRIAIGLIGLGLGAGPALAATATVRISAIVPVECSVDVLTAVPTERGVALTVRRRCNTSHAIIMSGNFDAALAGATIRYNNDVVALQSGYQVIPQPERYFDGVDKMVFEIPAADAETIERYAASMSIGIETF